MINEKIYDKNLIRYIIYDMKNEKTYNMIYDIIYEMILDMI